MRPAAAFFRILGGKFFPIHKYSVEDEEDSASDTAAETVPAKA